jgi:hypothetical protein
MSNKENKTYKEALGKLRRKQLLTEIFNTQGQYDERLELYERYEQNLNYLLTLFKDENHDPKNERTES